MADKLPGDDTGTFSIHNGSDDRNIINRLGWEGVGASNIWTRALTRSEELSNIGRCYDRFLAGELTLGQLLKRLNQVRKYK